MVKNESGFYLKNPINKKGYICEKLILSHKPFQKETNSTLKIKLSCDSTQINRKYTQLLNFTFNLLDDYTNNSNVNGIYILGIYLIFI